MTTTAAQRAQELVDWYHTTRSVGGPSLREKLEQALLAWRDEALEQCLTVVGKVSVRWDNNNDAAFLRQDKVLNAIRSLKGQP